MAANEGKTIPKNQAADYHKKLGGWGLKGKEEHNEIMSEVLGRPIESFTEIKVSEIKLVHGLFDRLKIPYRDGF